MGEHYDIIIIGTGAGGGTLAHALALAGKKLLVLERGTNAIHIARKSAPPRALSKYSRRAVFSAMILSVMVSLTHGGQGWLASRRLSNESRVIWQN